MYFLLFIASAVTTSKTNSTAKVTKYRSGSRSEDRAPLAEKNESSKYKVIIFMTFF